MEKNLGLFSRVFTILAIVFGLVVLFSTIPGIQLFTTDLGLYVGYALFFVAIAAAIIFPVINIIQNPKGAIKSVGGLAVMVIIFVIAYSSSTAEPMMNAITGDEIASAGVVQYAGAAIATGTIVFLAAALVFIVFEVVSFFR